ncbi:MAG: O-antigen ligase family protein [Bacteroides sp.]|nr:O-antigen ligase family protein [Bacteroides sp.]
MGGIEAVWGLQQLYGFTASGHARYVLTGSFFNPGSYAGYLAMVLPLCLYHWMVLSDSWGALKVKMKIEKCLAGGVGLCILCVLPATMSRSAWLAAGLSCLWIYGGYKGWGQRCRDMWHQNKRRVIMVPAGVVVVLVLAGSLLFLLKPDSAKGRLFMWKISCRAVVEKPLIGHGVNNFAGAYGEAQEKYFAEGNYARWEEYVAGSPEYAFNEYLRCAVELGLLVTVCLLFIIGICLIVGKRKQRWGVCGAIISLLIFSFSSYPLQLPVFIITFVGLLAACVIGHSRIGWVLFAVGIGVTGLLGYGNDRKRLTLAGSGLIHGCFIMLEPTKQRKKNTNSSFRY